MGGYPSRRRAIPTSSTKRKVKKQKNRKGQNGFLRLERAVTKLVEDRIHLSEKIRALRAEVDQRDVRMREIEAEMGRSAKRRDKAVKKVDALIARLDEIESEVMAEPLSATAVQGK